MDRGNLNPRPLECKSSDHHFHHKFTTVISTTLVLLKSVVTLQEEVKVTRKYQVTIPQKVRSKLGVKIGDKLIVTSENKRIILEAPKRVSHPSDVLWCLFGKPLDIDATRLVEESWSESTPALAKYLKRPKKEDTT